MSARPDALADAPGAHSKAGAGPDGVAGKRKFRETLASARLGVGKAQFELGLMHANGVGTRVSLQFP